MKNFLKVIILLAILGIAVVASLLVLDVASTEEMQDVLQKFLLILAVLALSGLAIDVLVRPKKD